MSWSVTTGGMGVTSALRGHPESVMVNNMMVIVSVVLGITVCLLRRLALNRTCVTFVQTSI